MAYADQLGVRWASPVDASLLENPCYACLTKREQDALVLSRVDGPKAEFRNLSQSVGRINARSTKEELGREVAPTMLPGHMIWVESQQRLLTGEEALIMQGFPILRLQAKVVSLPEEVSTQGFLRDLAGNAMAFPVVLAIFQAGLASLPWRAPRATPQEEDGLAVTMAALAELEGRDFASDDDASD